MSNLIAALAEVLRKRLNPCGRRQTFVEPYVDPRTWPMRVTFDRPRL